MDHMTAADDPTAMQEVAARHTSGSVPGLAWLVAHGEEVRTGVAGTADVAGDRPVRRDTIFRISSMTKPIVAVAALTFVEEGRLDLDEPVDPHLPELADRRVLTDPDDIGSPTVPAERPITLRDLLTFRLGIGMDFGRLGDQPVLARLAEMGLPIGPPAPGEGPDAHGWIAAVGSVPLERQPGERWLYHLGADVLGVLLARVGGASLGEVLQERVLDPLGMADTGFRVPSDSLDRFTDCAVVDPGSGVLGTYDPIEGQWSRPAAFESGGGGLVSTIDDYWAFAAMLRRGGAPLLSPTTVAEMTRNHLTAEQQAASSPDTSGAIGWGFGLGVRTRVTDEAHVGTYGWNGGLGTVWATDPVADLTGILLTNAMWSSPEAPAVIADFWTAAYGGLVGS